MLTVQSVFCLSSLSFLYSLSLPLSLIYFLKQVLVF